MTSEQGRYAVIFDDDPPRMLTPAPTLDEAKQMAEVELKRGRRVRIQRLGVPGMTWYNENGVWVEDPAGWDPK